MARSYELPVTSAVSTTRSSGRALLAIYTLTIFVSATLLFLVQPMFARMVLPLLGGTPAVWNTAMVFYQGTLLAGYIYAHATTKWLSVRKQIVVHLSLLLVPLAVLPLGIPADWMPPTASNPIPWLLMLLLVSVGVPFFVVSASSPLLQKWFAKTGHHAGADPYFLYAASNLGSMLALLSYPTVVEPYLRLHDQSRLWTVGYGVLVVLMCGCGVLLWRSPRTERTHLQPAPEPGGQGSIARMDPLGDLTIGRRVRWVVLALVPSSLLLSVTSFLSMDVAAIPLLWVIPLALYLLTFVLVFARKPILPHSVMRRAMPIALMPLIATLMVHVTRPLTLLVPLHLVTFFILTMVCHGELAKDRPATEHLTEFYLWMSVGGVLGGVFNALVAPMIFTSVAEYPIALVLACLVGLPVVTTGQRWRRLLLDFGAPLALGLLTAGSILGMQTWAGVAMVLGRLFLTVLAIIVLFSFSRNGIRFGLGVAAILLANVLYMGSEGHVLYAERSFFGISRVTSIPGRNYQSLMHGATLHGMQSLDPARRREPLTYYFATGPLGHIFDAFGTSGGHRSIAAVGLGSGSIACYGHPGDRVTFYEIDPTVERIARDPRYFTFLRDCPADVILGDARLSLRAAQSGQFDMIILDAYSSDAIPVHLITREALQLYLDKLGEHGLLVFHISNAHLDLEPVLGNLAQDAGLTAINQLDLTLSADDEAQGKASSQWVVMARRPADLGTLATDPKWKPAEARTDRAVWTDDFSSVLSVFNWK